jgi:hypothetical protein
VRPVGTTRPTTIVVNSRRRSRSQILSPDGPFRGSCPDTWVTVYTGGGMICSLCVGKLIFLHQRLGFAQMQRTIIEHLENSEVIAETYKSRRKNYSVSKERDLSDENAGRFLDSNGNKTGDVVIDAHPESFRLAESGNRIFVNVPDKKEIEVIDRVKLTVLGRWPVTSADGNIPMALDEAHHRLFVATWTPSRMLVFDTETGKEITAGETAGPSDDLFYDSRRGRVYVLTGAGFLEVFQDRGHNQFDRVGHYVTPPHTQTGLFVPEWGKLFAAARESGLALPARQARSTRAH